MKNIPTINTKRKVYKSNEIFEAIMNFDITALKLITICASQINKEDRGQDKDFIEYTFTYKALADVLEYGEHNHTHLKDIVSRMIVPITIPTDTGYVVVPFLEKAVYNEKKGTLTLKFAKEITPYLLNLTRYNSYELWNIIKLKSKHSFHIYELLKAYENLKVRTITINELKKILLIEDKYERYTDLRAWVIEPAQKEIAQRTDITFDFRPIKTIRTVTAIEFTIYSKNSKDIIDILPINKLDIPTLDEEIQNLKDLFKEQDIFLSKKNSETLYEQTKSLNLKKDDWIKVASSLKTEQKKGRIQKPIAYLLKDPESIIQEILHQNTLFKKPASDYEWYISNNELAELAAINESEPPLLTPKGR